MIYVVIKSRGDNQLPLATADLFKQYINPLSYFARTRAMTNKIIETLRSVANWAPIPLFAENLRSQQELISAITTRTAMSACLTGCLRDFHRLWNVDYLELFGQSPEQRRLAVTSVRHGNAFDLANAALLENAGIVRRHDPIAANTKTANALRHSRLSVLDFVM